MGTARRQSGTNPQLTGYVALRTPCIGMRTLRCAGLDKNTRETRISDERRKKKPLVRLEGPSHGVLA